MYDYDYDLEAIKNKTKQYIIYILVLLALLLSLIAIRRVYLNNVVQEYKKEVKTEELGPIKEDQSKRD